MAGCRTVYGQRGPSRARFSAFGGPRTAVGQRVRHDISVEKDDELCHRC
jgi:hypothetical protein